MSHPTAMPVADRAVILLHGLGGSRADMWRMGRGLRQAGWTVVNLGYPSLRHPLAHHADLVRAAARTLHANGVREIALVGHSLGGLVARLAAAYAHEDGWTLGRIVLLGSPAKGSAIAEALKDVHLFRVIAGACGQAVTLPRAAKVPIPDTEIAVIAGGTGNRGFNPFLTGDNDGIVTVNETRLPGVEADFLLLRSVHRTLPLRRDAVLATSRFLATGRLLPQPQSARS